MALNNPVNNPTNSRWSIQALAREFGLNPQLVADRLRQSGAVPVGTNRGFPVYALATAGPALFTSRIAGQDEDGESVDPEKLHPRDRKDWYAGEGLRVQLAIKRGELVTIDEYRDELAGVLKEVAATLETLPDVLERKCGLSPEAIDTMQRIIDEQRAMLADRIAHAA